MDHSSLPCIILTSDLGTFWYTFLLRKYSISVCLASMAMFLSNLAEVNTGQAIIEDLDDETLGEMIHFLYTGGLSGARYDIVSLCYAARKYELASLMSLIRLNMDSVVLDPKQLADLFIASDMFSQEPLFEVAVEKLKEGMEMLEDVLENMKDRAELIIKIFVAVK